MRRLIGVLSCAYTAGLLLGWWMIWSQQFALFPITLFLLSPRWILATPLVILMTLSAIDLRRRLLLFGIAAAVLLFPLLGLKGGGILRGTRVDTTGLCLMTANLGGGTVDLGVLAAWMRTEGVEMALVQECSASEARELFSRLGWQYRQIGQAALGTTHRFRRPSDDPTKPSPLYGVGTSMVAEVELDDGSAVRVVSVHLPTFRPALEKLRNFDVMQSVETFAIVAKVYQTAAGELSQAMSQSAASTLLGGDFNIPVESKFYRDYWNVYVNAFDESGNGFGFTKYTRWHGVRIDHILSTSDWAARRSRVGPDIGGDHRPLIAELTRKEQP